MGQGQTSGFVGSLGVAHERGICLLTVRAIIGAADVTVGGGADIAVCECGADGEGGLVRRRMGLIAEDKRRARAWAAALRRR